MYKESWKFTVGDNTTHGGFVNKALERGEEYVIFQRALTRDNDVSKCKSIFQSISCLQGNYYLSQIQMSCHSASNPTASSKWDFLWLSFRAKTTKLHQTHTGLL